MTLHLFEAYGLELEYMIVHRDSLSVRPICDEVLEAVAGEIVSEVERGETAWSNELVAHVIELKTNGPAASLAGLDELFQRDVAHVNELLAAHDARLMPGAMHPWMDPDTETTLWAHEFNEVYEAFNRVFDCRGHGWSNLQSTHINLPFAGDEEFGRLHAAIRLVLPILPALAASSPLSDGKPSGLLDTRLEVYRHNARKIPSLSGRVIPEPLFTAADYRDQLLARLYRDIAPHDPAGTLQHEWLNARGAIARFERDAIEIRVLDIQECPRMDLAVAGLIVATLKALTEGRWCSTADQQRWPIEPLEPLLLATIRDAERARISDAAYLRVFGMTRDEASAGELWRHIIEQVADDPAIRDRGHDLALLAEHGTLSRRILGALAGDYERSGLRAVYGALCDCLAHGRAFRP